MSQYFIISQKHNNFYNFLLINNDVAILNVDTYFLTKSFSLYIAQNNASILEVNSRHNHYTQ